MLYVLRVVCFIVCWYTYLLGLSNCKKKFETSSNDKNFAEISCLFRANLKVVTLFHVHFISTIVISMLVGSMAVSCLAMLNFQNFLLAIERNYLHYSFSSWQWCYIVRWQLHRNASTLLLIYTELLPHTPRHILHYLAFFSVFTCLLTIISVWCDMWVICMVCTWCCFFPLRFAWIITSSQNEK